MLNTKKFEKLILGSFLDKFPGDTQREKVRSLIIDQMIRQIITKNKREKFFIYEDIESIELLNGKIL
ncbi:MAG: hypothetical protein PV340_00585 [Wolbachia sp.]|nr:hypothetical protein [Wolbachia sp.]MDD9336241.1 hypothetical protein [Wolbachia sp.]